MPYQYKRELLNDDEVNKITNSCSSFREEFAIWSKQKGYIKSNELLNFHLPAVKSLH